MPNATRTIILLLVFAVGGLSALGFVAYRYTRLLEGGAVSAEEATQQVDAFIRVRRAMVREIESGRLGPENPSALVVARDRALALHDIDAETYAKVRGFFRSWREGRLRAGSPMASALERRRVELGEVDLGPYAPLDF